MRAVDGAVVADEDEDRVVVEAEFGDESHHLADLAVHAGDHGGVGCLGLEVRDVALAAGVGWIVEFAEVLGERIVRHLESDVRHSRRPVEKEGLILVVAGEFQRGIGDEIGRVFIALEALVGLRLRRVFVRAQRVVRGEGRVVEVDGFVVVPKVGGIEIVSHALAVVAEPAVKALLQLGSSGGGSTEAPLPEAAGGVAGGFEDLRQRDGGVRDGELSFVFRFAHHLDALGVIRLPVVADEGVAGVLAGHQHAAGRCADRIAAVVLGELHALGCQSVHVRRLDDLLAVAAEIPGTQVIGQDEDDVRLAGVRGE